MELGNRVFHMSMLNFVLVETNQDITTDPGIDVNIGFEVELDTNNEVCWLGLPVRSRWRRE